MAIVAEDLEPGKLTGVVCLQELLAHLQERVDTMKAALQQ
jgi:hypothetical protein